MLRIDDYIELEQETRDIKFIDNIHTIDDFKNDVKEIFRDEAIITKKMRKSLVLYYNTPNAFDIETTSFYKSTGTINPLTIPGKMTKDRTKSAFMYIWQVMLNGYIVIGRTWKEFMELIETLNNELNLDENKRLVIYVHNLAYEFQFMRKYFKIKEVFATDRRTPVKFRVGGVEFRDSLILSGYALRNLHKDLMHEIHKKDGDLDYELIRHKNTELTSDELLYCIYDVYIVSVYIWEKLQRGETITKIPMTKTGYVRNRVRNDCITGEGLDKYKYRELIKKLRLSVFEYNNLRKTYQGGFTHGNTLYMDDTIGDVVSMDFTSSYPTVLIAEKYPMTSGKQAHMSKSQRTGKNAEKFIQKLRNKDYTAMFQIRFDKLKAKISQDSYISESKCEVLAEPAQVENGRVYEAETVITYITDIDFDIIKEVYEWENIEISEITLYKLGYLPTLLIKTILDFYIKKTTLKDVKGKELEYSIAKSLLNSIYGMMVQNPLQPLNEYGEESGEWTEEEADVYETIKNYNESRKRTNFYPWGVWCCAYARRNLWTGGILPLGDDYIYSDTDSVKFMNYEKNKHIFEEYNIDIIKKLEKAMEYHNLDTSMISPETIKGNKKPLGVWDFDGHYKYFKTLGAKRYLVEKDNGEVIQTVAGLPKKQGSQFFQKHENPFKIFTAGDKDDPMYVPPEETGKMLSTYIDEDTSGVVTDYKGETAEYDSRSCIHMEKTSFSLSLSDEFSRWIEQKKLLIN